MRARPAWAARRRGDIHYRFIIDVPASLSDEQSEAVEKLSQVMNATRESGCSQERPTAARRPESRVDSHRGVFMISVAAELADMHPQTLRKYEAAG